MKRTIQLGKVAYSSKQRRNAVEVEIALEEKDKGLCLSIVGGIWNSSHTDYDTCGQCYDSIAELFPNSPSIARLVAIWKRWHLNDMRAGTPEQETAIKEWLADGKRYDYTAACDHLASVGLNPHNGYKYGHAWLYEPLPQSVINELHALMDTLDKTGKE